MAKPFEIEYATIDWQTDGVPVSRTFDDSYFSRAGGLQESNYIFIEQNHLAKRFEVQKSLTICELGFGTGLNFLLSWKCLRESKNTARLDYVSCEQYPLTKEDMRRALSPWNVLQPQSEELIEQLFPLTPGILRFLFEEGRVSLTLLLGDARELLPELEQRVDVWYLDGFSPAKNRALWGEEVFKHLTRLSQAGATLSSFTAASRVRTQLESAGFSIEKIPGFAGKRESIRGTFRGSHTPFSLLPPWKRIPTIPATNSTHAIVIGGGLAGYGAADALALRGFSVTLLEASASGFAGPSGNKAGIFTPYLARETTWATDLYLSSYQFSSRRLAKIERSLDETILHRSGARQFTHTKRLEMLLTTFDQLGVDPQIARIQGEQIEFTNAGWIAPINLCKAIERFHAGKISVHLGARAVSLLRSESGWIIKTEGGERFESEVVILATAFQANQLSQAAWIPLEAIRGEVISASSSTQSQLSNTILMGAGYVLPAFDNQHVIGATYIHGRIDDTPDTKDQNKLLQQAQALLPALQQSVIIDSRVSFRTSTHHRLPYIGPIVKQDSFEQIFADLKRGFPPEHYSLPEYHRNLYISAGHGSRGLLSTLAAGELLANYITGTTPLFKASLCGELNPSSYLAKEIVRRKEK